ncbi:MAG: ABC transporter substrate-binding protein [Chloroflexi bacterium]|nr:ABC transporter substrate-binding protein [Chloroflexota bacterium]
MQLTTRIRPKALWALAGLLALLALLGACAGAEPTATPTSTPTPTTAVGPAPTPTPKASPTPTPTPRVILVATPTPTPTPGAVKPAVREPRGGITVANGPLANYPQSPDYRFGVSGDVFFLHLAFEWLVGVTPDHQLVSMLAESWETPDNGHTWVFKLRKGVKFHNGKEMTAEDVATSYNSCAAKGTNTTLCGWNRSTLTAFEVVDKYTVRTSLKREGDKLFLPAYLGRSSWYGQVISPKELFEKYPDRPWPGGESIGTGPYRLVEVVRGEKMRSIALDPKTDWAQWRVVPAFKEVNVLPVKEDGTRIAMLKTGAADLIDVPTALKKEVASYAKASAKHGATAGLANIMGMDHPLSKWWSKKEVRMALNLAIDRQEIADFLFNGEAEPIAALHFSPTAEGFDPNLKPHPYDPAKARQLLKDANYDMNFVWNIWLRAMGGVPELQALGEAIAAKWEKELGLKTKLVPTDATVSQSAMEKHDPAIVGHFLTRRSTNFPDLSVPINTFSVSAALRGSHTTIPWHEASPIDPLNLQLAAASDPKERARIAGQIQRYLHDEFVHVGDWSVHVLYAYNAKTIGKWTPLQGSTYLHFLEYAEPPS